MAADVAILVPDASLTAYAERWRAAFSDYAHALEGVGLSAEPRPWTAGPLPGARLHLALLAWGYHLRPARWDALLATWPDEVALANAPALLRWNTRKTYLAELERRGVATIPTVFLDRATPEAVEAARARLGGGEVVLKPQVSAGSHDTVRLKPGEAGRLDAAAMVQPFLPAVGDEGELSVFAFAGRTRYAIAKRAAEGDFRVQPQFGGVERPVAPTDEMEALAAAALAGCPQAPLYARIDMLRDADGGLRLIELEAIEPDLYLEHAPHARGDFAAAVRAAADAGAEAAG
jgi:glutathione synthase/RimK-type ligase-like ATP-grasp enzyme